MLCFSLKLLRVALPALLLSLPAAAATLTVRAQGVNFRESANGKVICTLSQGDRVEQLGKAAGGWVKIKASGVCAGTGYVSEKLVAAQGSGKSPAKPAVKEVGAQKVPLIITEKYNPQKEVGRGLTEFTSSLGLLTFGNLYKATALDMESMLKEKLSMPELRDYFPNESERNKLAARIAGNINEDYLRGGLTNEKIIGATRYAADEILGLVIHRAMAKEGVKAPERRAIWAQKIISPFRACMAKARTYHEGNNCLDAAQEDAVKNIGLGIAYEMIRQEMGPAYTNGISQPYQKCLNLKKPGANDRVKGCVMALVRNAAADYGIDKVKEAASTDAPESAEAIGKSVRPAFEKCLAKAGGREGFARCADQLIGQAGGEIAAAAVMNNEHVRKYFATNKERQALADAGKEQFLDCVAANRAAGRKDSSGNVKTDNCVHQVRLETARSVVHGLIAGNLAKMEDLAPGQRKEIQAAIGKKIDGCWDSKGTDEKNNACMKDGIENLVGAVAEIKLANKIPPALNAQEPKLKKQLVQNVQACIREDLPDDVMHSSNAAEKVDGCAAKLLREAALKVADFELRQVIHGKTSDEKAGDALVEKLVGQDLAACLGPSPTDAILSKCTTALKKNAAYSVGELLFKEEFDRFVAKNGGMRTLQIVSHDRLKFLEETLTQHRRCLDEKVKSEEGVDLAVDTCFKSSIHNLASYLGKLAFQKSSREHVSNPGELKALSARFQNDLSACLQEKADAKYSLNDYIFNIDGCANRLAGTYTLELGTQQITKALEANLSGPALAPRRVDLQKSLIQNFSGCLASAKVEADRDACVDTLKRDATKEVTILAAREQAKTLLNGGKIPAEFDEAEKKLQKCLAAGTEPDLCARQHAQNVAKILGSLKLKVTLASSLGEENYKKSGRTIASLESDFFACVDGLPGRKPDAAFLKALKECGEKMEAKGITFAQASLSVLLDSPGASALEIMLRQEAANAIPCLGPILPAGPVNEDALQKIRPEGILQAVAKAIGDYINYDAKTADKHLDQVLERIITDLEAAGPIEARRNLLDLLIKGGMTDQLLKSMVRAQVRKALAGLPAEEQLSQDLQRVLMDPATLDTALPEEVLAQLRPFMADRLLKPLLIDGKTLTDPGLKASMKELEQKVALILLESRAFGDRLVAGAVQQQIDTETSGITGWFGSWVYSYDWNELRNTPDGRRAEAYVKDHIVKPIVTGQRLPPEEMRAHRAEAAALVKRAVQNQ
jgi:hypothetical protein